MTRRRSINDRRSCGSGHTVDGERRAKGELESRYKVKVEGGGGEGRREKDRSVELVPFHGSLETIILIKLTSQPTPRI